MKGYIHSVQPNPIKDNWVARIDCGIHRKKFGKSDFVNGGGMAIYYVQQLKEGDSTFYGYDDYNFEGFALQITP